MITVYNPLSRPVSHFVRIPVVNESYEVYDFAGKYICKYIDYILIHILLADEVPSQVVPIFDLIQNIPGRNSEATNELVFQAKNIPPLGSKVFSIRYVPEKTKISDDFSGLYVSIFYLQ